MRWWETSHGLRAGGLWIGYSVSGTPSTTMLTLGVGPLVARARVLVPLVYTRCRSTYISHQGWVRMVRYGTIPLSTPIPARRPPVTRIVALYGMVPYYTPRVPSTRRIRTGTYISHQGCVRMVRYGTIPLSIPIPARRPPVTRIVALYGTVPHYTRLVPSILRLELRRYKSYTTL